jgi:thiol:disulfide interchange protein DsbD
MKSIARAALPFLAPWALVLLCGDARAAGPYEEGPPPKTANRIDFTLAILPADPFSESNGPGARPGPVRRGEVFTLVITGVPKPGYHTYPLTGRTATQEESQLSRLTYAPSDAFTPLWPVKESPGVFVDEGEGGGVLLEHEGPFTWSQDVYVKPTAPPGQATLRFTVNLQVCKTDCVLGDHAFAVPLTISSEPPEPPTPELEARLKTPEPKPQVVTYTPDQVKKRVEETTPRASQPGATPAAPTSPAASGSGRDAGGLFATILRAILGGLVSLLTPCVFPMIPITVSFFLKQAEKREHRALSMAAVYSSTIVVVLTAGGMALIPFLVAISQHYATNFALAAVFLVFALSLLGMYDITLPSWLTRVTSSHEGQGGLLGACFMALTFSIISFACVGPIYGGFITLEAAGQSGAADWLRLFLAVFSFSLAFASPFFLLALFPTLLRSLPRSGSWLNSVKVVMGFLELAAVFKFLRGAELNLLGKSEWFTFDLTLGIYVALCLACSLYLLNVYRLPHDHDAPETIGVPRLLFSLAFLALGLYLAPGMFKNEDGAPQRPRGEVFLWVRSFLLPEPELPAPPDQARNGGARSTRLVWLSSYPEALKQAAAQKKPIFIDFTGLG